MDHMTGNCQWAGLASVPENDQSLVPWVTCHLLLCVLAADLGLKPRATLGERPAYQGPVHCIATIVRTEGLAGLYRGASAMLLRDVPGYCLYFIPYVLLSDWITPEACAGPSPCAVWLAGGLAGKAAELIPVSILATARHSWGPSTPSSALGRAGRIQPLIQEAFVKCLICARPSWAEEGLRIEEGPRLSPILSSPDLCRRQVPIWAQSPFCQKTYFEHLLCVRYD